MSDPDDYLKKAEVISFDMIYKSIKGNHHQQKCFDKYYQTVYSSDLKQMSQKQRKKTVGACLRSDKKIFVEKKPDPISFFRASE